MIEKDNIINSDWLDALKLLPSCSINCGVTSPPYYGLRDYGVDGQLGLEATPGEYISKLVEGFREFRRVLRDDGTLWINIADSYAGSCKGASFYPKSVAGTKQGTNRGTVDVPGLTKGIVPAGCKPKDLIGIPWLLAFALRADGWYLRQEIIWAKPNPMPESVTDRCTKSHETVFLLSKSPRYYFDAESIKEPCVGANNDAVAGSIGTIRPNTRRRLKGNSKTFRGGGAYTGNKAFDNSVSILRKSHGNEPNNELTRNKRDVWVIATRGCSDAHFATFPPELVEPCILAGCPEGGIVCDMFFGSGTVGVVAKKLNRHYVGIELNLDYVKLAENRIFDATAQTKLF